MLPLVDLLWAEAGSRKVCTETLVHCRSRIESVCTTIIGGSHDDLAFTFELGFLEYMSIRESAYIHLDQPESLRYVNVNLLCKKSRYARNSLCRKRSLPSVVKYAIIMSSSRLVRPYVEVIVLVYFRGKERKERGSSFSHPVQDHSSPRDRHPHALRRMNPIPACL